MKRPNRFIQLVVALAVAAAIPGLLIAACKKKEDDEPIITEPEPEKVEEEPAGEPDAAVLETEEPDTGAPTPFDAAPDPSPTTTNPQPRRDGGTTSDAGKSDGGTTSDAGSGNCLSRCQSALSSCLVPKPGKLPDPAECNAVFERCRAGCQR
jgi:hypothetical protein